MNKKIILVIFFVALLLTDEAEAGWLSSIFKVAKKGFGVAKKVWRSKGGKLIRKYGAKAIKKLVSAPQEEEPE